MNLKNAIKTHEVIGFESATIVLNKTGWTMDLKYMTYPSRFTILERNDGHIRVFKTLDAAYSTLRKIGVDITCTVISDCIME